MAEAGCDSVVMEVSSQGLMLHRTAGFTFDIGIFTNIEPDHIGPNEHKDFEDYMHCKSLLFQQCKVGIFNGDDPHLAQILEGHTCQVETFGFSEKADLRAENTRLVTGKGTLGIAYDLKGLLDFPVEIDLPGKFSVYNSLTAIAAAVPRGLLPSLASRKIRFTTSEATGSTTSVCLSLGNRLYP